MDLSLRRAPCGSSRIKQARLRAWRNTYAQLDQERAARDLARWLATPRTNPETRERVAGYDGAPQGRPAAHWDQPLLAYADRARIIPPELLPLQPASKKKRSAPSASARPKPPNTR
jgi:hypothetical protein